MAQLQTATRPLPPGLPVMETVLTRAGLPLVLLAALAVRLWIVATQTYVVWPDETFQYLEPAHRLVFGSGVVTWEFLDGIRSWFLPGILAAVIWPVSRLDPDPLASVGVLRLMCVLASLSIPFVGYRLVGRRCGPAPAILAGLLCALATETVYFAPVIMAEPLATDAALLAVWFGDATSERPLPRRRLLLAGLLFGLAASLRYQYAPVLALAALVQHARRPRNLAVVAAAGGMVVLLTLGALDALTWGTPFQSVWLNYMRNAVQGVSGAMGQQPWSFYPSYYLVAWGVATGALAAAALLGALRIPVLGVIVVCTLALHSLTPHKELRFVFLATACLPMLVGAGLGRLMQRLPRLRPPTVGLPVAVALALAISAETAATTYARATPLDAWHRGRSILAATAAARAYPGVCGLAIRTLGVYRTGGYTYWDRDLPIYFETWEESQQLKSLSFRLRLESRLDGRAVPQYPGAALAANTDRFNVILGARDDGLPGFALRGCYGSGTKDDKTFCLFARPGGCR